MRDFCPIYVGGRVAKCHGCDRYIRDRYIRDRYIRDRYIRVKKVEGLSKKLGQLGEHAILQNQAFLGSYVYKIASFFTKMSTFVLSMYPF